MLMCMERVLYVVGGCDVVATEYGRYSFVLYAATVSSAGSV